MHPAPPKLSKQTGCLVQTGLICHSAVSMATTVLGVHVTQGSFSWLVLTHYQFSKGSSVYQEKRGGSLHWYLLERHKIVAYESISLSRPRFVSVQLKGLFPPPPLLILFLCKVPLIYSPFKNVFLCLLRGNVNYYIDKASIFFFWYKISWSCNDCGPFHILQFVSTIDVCLLCELVTRSISLLC